MGSFQSCVAATVLPLIACGARTGLLVPGGGGPRDSAADIGPPEAAAPARPLDVGCPHSPGLQAHAPWPTNRRCSQRSAGTPAVGLRQTQSIAWTSTGQWTGEPVIAADGTIYATNGPALSAVDPGGNLLWTASGGSGAWLAIGTDGTIYNYGAEVLRAVHPDGTTAWSQSIAAAAFCSPGPVNWGMAVGDDGTIYVLWHTNAACGSPTPSAIEAFAPDGSAKWTLGLDAEVPASPPSVGIDGNLYFVSRPDSGGPSSLVAVTPAGVIAWQTGSLAEPSGDVISGVAVSGDGTIYVASGPGLAAARPDGTILWTQSFPSLLTVPAIAQDGTAYVVEESGHLHALHPGGGEAWEYTIGSPPMIFESPPIVGGDGTVYVGGVAVLDAQQATPSLLALSSQGVLQWQVDVGAPAAIGGDGTVYAVDAAGTLAAVSP